MPTSQPVANEVLEFATSWIARNIEVGPFSCNDTAKYDGPIRAFKLEAAQAGFSETDLEHGIGAVPAFIAKAYADAVGNWRAAQEPGRAPAATENSRVGQRRHSSFK